MNEEVKNIPQLRFPSFNDVWKTKHFEDLFEFRTTNSFSRDQLTNISGSIRNIHYGDIHTKFGMLLNINKTELPKIIGSLNKNITDNSYCIDGDLVIADASEDYKGVGKSIELINVSDSKIISGLHTILARQIYDDFSRGFMGYLMNSDVIHNQVKFYAVGSKVYSISKSNLCKLVVNFPSKDEQTKIANFLSVIDQTIENLEEKIRLLELQKKGIMQRIFNQEFNFINSSKFVFKKWDYIALKNICSYSSSSLSVNSFDLENQIGDYPVYWANGIFAYSDVYQYDFDYISIIKDGAGVGRIQKCQKFSSATGTLGIIKNNEETCLEYLYYLLENVDLRKFKVGSTIPHIYFKDYGEILVPLPSLLEQIYLSNILLKLDEGIELTKTLVQYKKTLRKGLMQKMFI